MLIIVVCRVAVIIAIVESCRPTAKTTARRTGVMMAIMMIRRFNVVDKYSSYINDS